MMAGLENTKAKGINYELLMIILEINRYQKGFEWFITVNTVQKTTFCEWLIKRFTKIMIHNIYYESLFLMVFFR